ncbi:YdeI/OmpD-associated family protein [Erythrobacter sp. SDW2]|uniref:YdeI/OmpD-associated family protein n=1 Tax=Erythrobacter sp. SDW2 TaxID=2907154 RepID=UPI001F3A89DE|nr:YdeI/OmpD-associated family protein [Erythrobacter sp. SDW2]UIP05955.1 YdeI/OmpD-associated family protein [Erythrobacter sp. SDW2]
MERDPRIDAYIDKAAPFAQPILTRLRELAHEALPEGTEDIKWGMPHFLVGGKNVAGISAFKAHCALVIHGDGRQAAKGNGGMGGYGKIASLEEIPPELKVIAAIHAARDRVAKHGSATKGSGAPKPKPEIPMPDYFAVALEGKPEAKASFARLAPSHRREYLEWITEAKREETRAKRIASTLEWLAEGKKRNWKYENC